MRYYLNAIGLLILLFLETILNNFVPEKTCICLSDSKLIASGGCENKKIKEGVWIYRYSDGKPWAIGSYDNNKMNGIWIEFYDDSLHTQRSVTFYNQNKANGIRYIYDKDGMLIIKQLCKDDIILKEMIYCRDTICGVNYPSNASVTIPNLYDSDVDTVLMVNTWDTTVKMLKICILLLLLFFNTLYFLYKRHKSSPNSPRL
jgi:hypothetical protein